MSKEQVDEMSTTTNATNCHRVETLHVLMHEILIQVLRKEFYGNVSLRFTIQDGVIQGLQYTLEKSVR